MADSDPSDPDALFGHLVVQQGLARSEHVQECLDILHRLKETGTKPVPRLGDLLVGKGYLSTAQFEATIRQVTSEPSLRSSSGAVDPEEVGRARTDPSNLIGKYVRVSKLGAGGMGEVWKAWDTELSRWVALKFLKGSDDEEITRFKREAQTAGRLSHPNIAAIHEVGLAHERHYIAMQYVQGQTLKTFPRADRKGLVQLVRDAALAVQYAHDQGIVHRDLKPENVMVVAQAKSHHVYVMDFGLARATEGEHSVPGMVVGTPAYMPPEQSRGEKVDARADVYSLGSTLYELMTDRAPFKGANVYEILKKVQDEEPKAPGRIDPGIDRDLETLVLKCLEKDPARRYPTAGALAEELSRWLQGEAIEARPISRWERLRRKARRNKALTAAIASAVIILIAGGATLAAQRSRSAGELRRAEGRWAADKDRLRRLQEIWMNVVLRKRDLRSLSVPEEKARKDLADAVARIGTFIADNPTLPQGYYLKARGEFYLGNREQALKDVGKAIEGAPDFGLAKQLRGMILADWVLELDICTDDLRALRERERSNLVQLAQADFEAGTERGEAAQQWGLVPTPEDEVLGIVARALALAYRNKVRAAVDLLRKEAEGRRAEEYAAALWIFTKDSEWETRLAEWGPGYAFGHFLRALAKAARRDIDGAIRDFDRVIELRPDYILAYMNRGILKQQRKDSEGALRDFDRAIELQPDEPIAFYNRGTLKQAQRKLDEAIRDLDRAIELRPDYARALVNRGITRQARGELEAAVQDFDRALALKPDASAFTCRGLAEQERKDYEAAIRDFDRALELKPDLVQALYGRGNSHRMRGQPEAGIRDLDRVIELKPDHAEALGARGMAKWERGDSRGAATDFEAALRVAPPGWALRPNFVQLLQAVRKPTDE